MARYIDCDKCYHGRVCAYRHQYHDMIIDCNHHKPTADVEEVKRGIWLDCIESGTTVAGIEVRGFVGYKCSFCGRYESKKEPYCNCGAKMDGGKEE